MERFDLKDSEFPSGARLNIAPAEPVATILNDARDILTASKWGLVPFWAQDPKIGNRMFNARAEGIEDKPSFRQAVRKRRCLIPADGFYEWRKPERGPKVPVRYALQSREPFAFAGLWEVWRPPGGGEPLRTCTIITCPPNDLIARVHDRMPVLLLPDREELWLDSAASLESALACLTPYPAERMTAEDLPPGSLSGRPGDPFRTNQLRMDSL